MNLSELAQLINNQTESVRSHISTHRYQSVLIEDTGAWNQVCSSIDVIEDSLEAVLSFASSSFPKDTGLKYIFTYGILQALFLMQDAVRDMSEALDVPHSLTERLQEIRALRNASIGHPTKNNQKKTVYHNYISRITMEKSGFDLIRSSPNQNDVFVRVNIEKACQEQLVEIVDLYRNIVEKLEEVDKMHKEEFRKNPLSDIFHSSLGYSFEKVSQGIHSPSSGNREFGHENLGIIRKKYEEFRDALKSRNELDLYTEFDLNEFFHAMQRLDEYFSESNRSLSESDARIYLSYLHSQHNHFVRVAKETDEEYKKA